MRIVLQFTLNAEEAELPLMRVISETVKACNYSTPSKPCFLVKKGSTVYMTKPDFLINFLRDGYEIVAVIQRS